MRFDWGALAPPDWWLEPDDQPDEDDDEGEDWYDDEDYPS